MKVTGCFQFLATLVTVLHENPRWSAWDTQTNNLAPAVIPCARSIRSLFSCLVWTTSGPCLHAFMYQIQVSLIKFGKCNNGSYLLILAACPFALLGCTDIWIFFNGSKTMAYFVLFVLFVMTDYLELTVRKNVRIVITILIKGEQNIICQFVAAPLSCIFNNFTGHSAAISLYSQLVHQFDHQLSPARNQLDVRGSRSLNTIGKGHLNDTSPLGR